MPAPDEPLTRTLWPLWTLIALCTLIELALTLADWGFFADRRLRLTVYEYAGFWPGLLDNWTPNYAAQPYTMFLSYGFLHGGPIHMIVNMITLYSLGQVVCARVGIGGFLVLYTLTVLGGALGFGLLAATTQPMVGASGGLFGLVGGILAWNYVDRFVTSRRLWPVARAVMILILLNLVLWWAMDGLVAWETHLGGFVCGWVVALLIDPRGQDTPPAPHPDDPPSGAATP